MTVNLGIGLPTRLVDWLDEGHDVCLHSENGISGAGPVAPSAAADRNLIDAGGAYITARPGAAFFDSAVSFALVRGGRLDLAVLGALEVSARGDLANWIVPGRFTPGVGGAMELAQKARRLVVLMSHVDREGRPKIVAECSLPVTALACVDRIITDRAVVDVTSGGLRLVGVADGETVEAIVAATSAPLEVADELETF